MAAITQATRLVRNPDLIVAWSDGRLIVRDLHARKSLGASPVVVRVLDLFSRPRSRASAVRKLSGYEPASVREAVNELTAAGLLLPAEAAAARVSRAAAWNGNLASLHYHVAARDQTYRQTPEEVDAFLRGRLAEEPPPPRFKRYRGKPRVKLPAGVGASGTASLRTVLRRRRTVRDFSPRPVPLSALSAIVRGTWGRTGWLDAGVLGRLPTRTSPSAGALHPVECYVMAWNVRGLAPGLYHYDVEADELRRLRAGDLREEAVQLASGQRWIAGAAFLCVMTAVFHRTLWKYRLENAYRSVWLDTGHLGQTFCLLATACRLGPFTTAAMQDTRIEALIGLDGVTEFPVYLCGAGRLSAS